MRNLPLIILSISAVGIGCSTINETSKRKMETGVYKVSNQHNKYYYSIIGEDSIIMHPAHKTKKGWIADTSLVNIIVLNETGTHGRQPITFVSNEPVFDVLSILFKYRPPTMGFPKQLLTNFNAAGYVGYRTNRYILSYEKNPLNSYQRKMHYFGWSVGFFAGLGAPEITPSVTNNNIEIEYYGVVLTKGITAMVSIGSLTFGLAAGFDHLMDHNRKLWIYQGKHWAGVTVGLSLN